MPTDTSAVFRREFLDAYLKFGLGSMTKADIDALVMWLLDRHGVGEGSEGPLAGYSNQTVSELLKTPVTKVKKLRYEAALKFGSGLNTVEDMAKIRLLHSLENAVFDLEDDKISLIIEDALVKHWLQGQLKMSGQIFDHPFNGEMIRASSDGLLDVLSSIYAESALKNFTKLYREAKSKKDVKARNAAMKKLAIKFTTSAATAFANGTVKLFMPVPVV